MFASVFNDNVCVCLSLPCAGSRVDVRSAQALAQAVTPSAPGAAPSAPALTLLLRKREVSVQAAGVLGQALGEGLWLEP